MARPQARLLGAAYGLLTVCDEAPGGRGAARRVAVRCDCGVTKVVLVTDLRSGRTRSCGCARWRADPDRQVSATCRLVVMMPPLARAQVTAIAYAAGVTPSVFMRSAVEGLLDDDAAEARAVATGRSRPPGRATHEVSIAVTPAVRAQVEALARQTRQTLTTLVWLALHTAAQESGCAPLLPSTPDPVRVPGIASRCAVGLHQPAVWRRKFPTED